MNTQLGSRYERHRARQCGQAVLLVVLLLAVGIGLFAYGAVSSVSLSEQQDVKTRLALTMARDALIGRAASDASRPGSLPCPDFDDGTVNPLNAPNDGVADLYAGSDCPSYSGRLPWKTLGLPDLRDDAGERLWYALSNNFRDNMSAGPLNSDTQGSRTVYHGSTAVTLTSTAVAVIFAPGTTLAGQIRDGTAVLCPTTGTTIARSLCAANYLEATGGANNAALGGAGPFVSAQRSDTFNDRLLVITTADLMPVVEQRVAGELRAALNKYYARTGVFPSANPYTDNDYKCQPTTYDGRIPLDIIGGCSVPPSNFADWAAGELPTWFAPNNWNLVMHYAVSNWCASTNASDISQCSSAGGLTVTGVTTKGRALIIAAGRGLGAQVRPCASASSCLEDAENTNGNTVFVSPVRSALNNDRLLVVAEAP